MLAIILLLAIHAVGINAEDSCYQPVSWWKQCAWQQVNSNTDTGLIHTCSFYKQRVDTHLRVVYQGNIRIQKCTFCCKRWYFTFNGQECAGPLPIDGVLYQNLDINIHRPTTIEGFCSGLAAGSVNVQFHVGGCKDYPGSADAYTSWNSVSRIIIEEVEPPQP